MRNILKSSLIVVLFALFFVGCGMNEPTPQMQGKMYSQVNMWEEKSKLISTNYERGRIIPVNSDVVIEGFVFHHFSCFENQYQISKDCDTTILCNTSCANLQYSNRLKNLIQISQKMVTD